MLMRLNRSKWLVPGFAVALGVVFLVAQWVNDQPGNGLVSLAIMVAFAAALVAFSGRSATFEVMRNPKADERSAMLDLRATAFAGLVVITVVVVAVFYELARGHDPSPYSQLGAVAGVAYLLALIVGQRRS
jgi:drug/metabolite transporter (DMT)-like permease